MPALQPFSEAPRGLLLTTGLPRACRALLRRLQAHRALLVHPPASGEEVAEQRELVGAVAAQPGGRVVVADVAGSAGVSVIVGAVLALAPLVASVTDRRRSRRPAC
jgi:hypothetical protein